MKHFTIFQGFYYAIAEMTEEEIVSTIGSFTYREKVAARSLSNQIPISIRKR